MENIDQKTIDDLKKIYAIALFDSGVRNFDSMAELLELSRSEAERAVDELKGKKLTELQKKQYDAFLKVIKNQIKSTAISYYDKAEDFDDLAGAVFAMIDLPIETIVKTLKELESEIKAGAKLKALAQKRQTEINLLNKNYIGEIFSLGITDENQIAEFFDISKDQIKNLIGEFKRESERNENV